MTQNEQVNSKIAEIMGWEYFPESGPFPFHNRDQWFDLTPWEVIKEMQDRMVADGWNITNLQWGIDKFCAWAKKSDDLKHSPDCDTEPAALHALFVKVYNIGGEA